MMKLNKESPRKKTSHSINKTTELALTGGQSSAMAMRQANPDVVAVYPITPQTPIMEEFAKFWADGAVSTELIHTESEHSVMSSCVGASAAGARVMTATASVGLALMYEILPIASGTRLPIVLNIANRALSAPINIHCDHSDSMSARDQGWIQIYSENSQEVYENTILAVKLAEAVNLPAMVCQDGFLTSHSVENTKIFDDKSITKFLGTRKPYRPLLDIKNPVTYGPLQLQNYYFETKKQVQDAMLNAKNQYLKIGKELKKITGNNYDFFEEYCMKDAEYAVITMSTTAGTTKVVVDNLRTENKKVGLIKIKLYRPFAYEELGKLLINLKGIAVLDRSLSIGCECPIYSDIKSAIFDKFIKDKNKTKENIPKIQSYVFGLGGREIFEKDIENVFEDMTKNKFSDEIKYIGLR
jgi:pyruvate ferredoxin oxidoreductase alpha subunit